MAPSQQQIEDLAKDTHGWRKLVVAWSVVEPELIWYRGSRISPSSFLREWHAFKWCNSDSTRPWSLGSSNPRFSRLTQVIAPELPIVNSTYSILTDIVGASFSVDLKIVQIWYWNIVLSTQIGYDVLKQNTNWVRSRQIDGKKVLLNRNICQFGMSSCSLPVPGVQIVMKGVPSPLLLRAFPHYLNGSNRLQFSLCKTRGFQDDRTIILLISSFLIVPGR